MAHFAELDDSGMTTKVLVVANAELLVDGIESEARGVDFLESLFGHRNWKQTSYNANFRKNFAGIGFFYDDARDAFIPPQPYPSWTLDEATCLWEPPTPMPLDGNRYEWDEAAVAWTR